MRISIVTLNFKKSHLTTSCLSSLFSHYRHAFEQNEMECIVVDNASPDDSVTNITKFIKEQRYKNVQFIQNKVNDGFGKGCNIGAKAAQGSYIIFLNNDTIVQDQSFNAMAEYMDQHQEVSILGGKLQNEDGSEQACTGSFYSPLNILLLLLGLQRYGVVDKNPLQVTQVDWVKGGLMMVRKDVFEKLGGFDEQIFMYTEDMEFCYRAMKHHYRVYFYPYTAVFHKETGSSNRTFAIVNIYKNLAYFYKKHKSYSEYLFVKSLLATKAQMLIQIGKLTKNKYYIQTYEEALKTL